MGDSRYNTNLFIMEKVLALIFSMNIEVEAFNRDYYEDLTADGMLEILFQHPLTDNQLESLKRILGFISISLKNSDNVKKCILGKANLQRGSGCYHIMGHPDVFSSDEEADDEPYLGWKINPDRKYASLLYSVALGSFAQKEQVLRDIQRLIGVNAASCAHLYSMLPLNYELDLFYGGKIFFSLQKLLNKMNIQMRLFSTLQISSAHSVHRMGIQIEG